MADDRRRMAWLRDTELPQDWGRAVSLNEKIAIVAPLVLVAVMYPVFQLLSGILGRRWGGPWPGVVLGGVGCSIPLADGREGEHSKMDPASEAYR